MATIASKRKSRAGHRAFVTRFMAEGCEEKSAVEVLRDRLQILKTLDDEVLELMSRDDVFTEEDVEEETVNAGKIETTIREKILALEAAEETSRRNSVASEIESEAAASSAQDQETRARLPKLRLKNFAGSVGEWQEFWDGFESSIHSNPRLATVDKFNYLRSLLVGPARGAVAGFALTAANYQSAIDLLKRRYGQTEKIKRAHINEIMKVRGVTSEKDAAGLRRFYDVVETKHRGLQALGVEAAQYESILVPALLEKIPEAVRLSITRGKSHENWVMEEMLAELLEEVELRERCQPDERPAPQEQNRGRQGPNSASALATAGTRKRCAFCLGEHREDECSKNGRTIRGARDEPVAIQTTLGWVLSGPLQGDEGGVSNVNLIGCDLSSSNVESEVVKLWDYETLGIREENEVHESLKDGIVFTGERYRVKLPWKEGIECLPSNYGNSVTRLRGQLARLQKEPDIRAEYDAIIKQQVESGIIERVYELESANKVHYLPHHAVVRKEAKTTKVRIVYDASSKERKRGVCLNDCLHVGPALTPLLYEILIRFRQRKIALVGDIEKAFLNIEVDEADRDCLRFLWVNDVEAKEAAPIIYRFCRVVFGVNCSPFLLNATLRYHLESFAKEEPEFVRVMKDSFYVDDLVTGAESADKALELFEKARARMATGGFKLRKWLSNDEKVTAEIRERENDVTLCDRETNVTVRDSVDTDSDEATYAKAMLGVKDEMSVVDKVLGHEWNCKNDEFRFDLERLADKAAGVNVTKRNTLKVMASMYDPLGIVSPIMVSMKVLFQELCVEKLDWDEELTGERKKRWLSWLDDLKRVKEVRIARCVYGVSGAEVTYSLHGFGDASKKAYCAVIYCVTELYGAYHVELLTSKTRVAPLKEQTIPRLELMSGRVLAQLMATVVNAISGEVELSGRRCWLDSKTALCWINNQGEWKQFVKQRVNEILRLTTKADWGHCPGIENPADIGSRGALASELVNNQLWSKGPQWLARPESEWPVTEEIVETTESCAEECKRVTVALTNVTKQSVASVVDIERYSSLTRLLRVTAWVGRFVNNLRLGLKGETIVTGALTIDELTSAELLWVKAAQSELRSAKHYKDLVKDLGVQECDGVLRCAGRLGNSQLENDTKNPILLPRGHKFTRLVMDSCHARVCHSGVRATLAELRARFWVPKGRQAVKKSVSECVVCKRVQGRPYDKPPIAALPEFRVSEAPPFSKTGVDFAGPVYIKSHEGMKKMYIALFTCSVTRALHLELTEDLSTRSFLNCLRRFCARRGTPALIVSDNAKTFKSAAKFLNELYDQPDIRTYCEENRIQWKFNLERAPWWGGFFERMVGTVKRCLKKVLGNARLNCDEMQTTLVELEGTLNSRPLTYEYDEVGAEMLTPSHLLFGRRLLNLPDELRDDEDEEVNGMMKRFRYLAKKRRHFWNRWFKEYLVDLREQHKVVNSGRKVAEVGDVVLLFDETLKRSEWKMAVVEELIQGPDGQVRGAVIRVLSRGKPIRMKRPVQRLYPLEVKCAEGAGVSKTVEGIEVPNERPKRAAALDAQWRTRSMIDS
ncbi:uncharacterized protein LOC116614572 [Nematostella vectensis]|uniref:uncharacterized protein LOC116614572 n=1 Tax=Nematostella vectensis TaxID=45351 RepID=UPI0020777E86|nr:uncharacterized protein LOC116614572 [Nematostella vectensis]